MKALQIKEELPLSTTSINDSHDILEKTFTDEIIIAICGQLGTDLHLVVKNLTDSLKNDFAYDVEVISMSDIIFSYYNEKKPKDEYERINRGMNLGNTLREEHSKHILADFAVAEISKSRLKETTEQDINQEKFSSRRKCFIINSLKNPDEYNHLRLVYGATLYLLGVFSPYDDRVLFLNEKFKREDYTKISELINRDTGEDIQFGQKVEKVFTESDYFIRTYKNDKSLTKRVDKFLNLLFDYNINTPTYEERAMYQAASASASSACLSRQVGACITDSKGNVLSIGWNEVPSAKGGVYENEENDHRCYKNKKCANSERKLLMKNDIINSFLEKELINDKVKSEISDILDSKLKNLIEFARSIHAEMHAIIIGSQKTGDRMLNGKLFCTTYPCHNCARHIVLAGISEVYYIEPYRKSLCLELHSDALTEKENDENNKVKILMYEGVAPKMFMKFYQIIKDNRKEKVINGDNRRSLSPKHRISLRALHQREAISVKYLKQNNLLE